MAVFLKESRVAEKGGIYVSREIAERTVWDKLATENPTHAVISAKNEEEARRKSLPQIEHIKQHVDASTVLLDLGCGYGRVAQYLLPTKRLARYIGVDSAYEMLQLFKDRYATTVAEQSTPVTLINADIHTLPLEDQCIDVVVVSAVFLHNHKSTVQRAIEELRRVMKPGATLLVYSSFPRSYTLMGVQGLLHQGLLNLMGKPMKNGPVRYYSQRELNKLFSEWSAVTYVPSGFAVLPKTIIILPGPLERLYRLGIANPVNRLLQKITPAKLKPYFAVHFDIIAKR
jgi:ubiquinone/menaquinone biosynthesis C-methylase UbiE